MFLICRKGTDYFSQRVFSQREFEPQKVRQFTKEFKNITFTTKLSCILNTPTFRIMIKKIRYKVRLLNFQSNN